MTRPSSALSTPGEGRFVLGACEAAELGGLLAGIAGWIADGHAGFQNMGLHVGMALNLDGPDGLGDLNAVFGVLDTWVCLLYTSPSPRDRTRSRMPSSA